MKLRSVIPGGARVAIAALAWSSVSIAEEAVPAAPPPPAATAAPPPPAATAAPPPPAAIAAPPPPTAIAAPPPAATDPVATPSAAVAVVQPTPVIVPHPIVTVMAPAAPTPASSWPAPAAAVKPMPEETPTADSAPGALIGAGLFVLAASYMPAIAVAESSDSRVDEHLYVPVAGPWLDLVRRPTCNAIDCSTEFGNRALIATDGLLQGLGAFMTLVGLLTLDEDAGTQPIAKNRDKPTVHVSPAQLGSSSYGVSAFGSF
jgi:hypothetical protein